MPRGPKKRTAANGLKPHVGGALWEGFSPPADLSAVARAEFDRLSDALSSTGALDRTDPRIVVSAARTHDLIERAFAELGDYKLTEASANGTLMPHPMLGVLNTLTMRLRRLWADMGLTPATSKLGTPKDASQANPWGDLLNVAG